VKRPFVLSVSTVWLITVLTAWVVTSSVLAVLIMVGPGRHTALGITASATFSAAFACGLVGGPATAVALRVRARHGAARAILGGLGTAALIMLFIWSFMDATGTPFAGPVGTVAPVVIVAIAEIGLAVKLSARRGPAPEPQPEPSSVD
jgi:hypothetical protein